MDLQSLRTFRKVVEKKSLTQAAEALHVAQPSVTTRIQALEEHLGQKLFTRHGRYTELTQAGRLLLPYVDRILAQMEEAEGKVRSLSATDPVTFTVGATQGIALYLLPQLIPKFAARHSGTRIVVRSATARQVVRMVLDNTVDVGITRAPVSHAGIDIAPLFEDESVAVVSPRHRLAGVGPVSLAMLRDEPLIAYDSSSLYWQGLERSLEEGGLRLCTIAEADQFEAVKALLLTMGGVSFFARFMVQSDFEAGRLAEVPLVDIGFRRVLYTAAWKTHRDSDALIADFAGYVRDWFQTRAQPTPSM